MRRLLLALVIVGAFMCGCVLGLLIGVSETKWIAYRLGFEDGAATCPCLGNDN